MPIRMPAEGFNPVVRHLIRPTQLDDAEDAKYTRVQ